MDKEKQRHDSGISSRLIGLPAISMQQIFPLRHFSSSLIKIKILSIMSYTAGQKYLLSQDPMQGSFPIALRS